MTVGELNEQLGLQVIAGANGLGKQVDGGYCGDLLSFVIGHANENSIWITVQAHMNSLAVAVMIGISAIILAEETTPDAAMCKKADEEGIPLLLSNKNSFELANQIGALL